jgi:rod shape-determining protein MreC
VIAAVIITVDLQLNQSSVTRAAISAVTFPFYWVADLPSRLTSWGEENVESRSELLEDNQRLRSEALLLDAQVQQMASLRAENLRLRALLNSSALLQDDVLVAELVGVSPDPARHLVVLDKGGGEGVYLGQPLIDANGLMGQVVEVAPNSARVLLITDATHAIPVQVNRNGVRAIAEGIGRLDRVELRHVASTEDIAVGDLLVSSGLGGRFPEGYPVATVTEIEIDPGQPFARVSARPNAALNRSRHVLLVFTGNVAAEE